MDHDLLLLELNAKWGWSLAGSWIPMIGFESIPHTAIYQVGPFEAAIPHPEDLLQQVFDLNTVYDIEEGGNIQIKPLADCAFYYDGLEHLYTNCNGDFMLYFSHEDSVTVGGEKLLAAIYDAWPSHKKYFWYDGDTYKLLTKS